MGCEFLRIKGILDQIRETKDETKTIAAVLRIKDILDHGGYNKPERVLCHLLSRLKQMAVSMKVLEVSMIGYSVSSLMNHASKDVRQAARTLVKAWRRVVDEWMDVNDNDMSAFQEIGKPSTKLINITFESQMVIGGHKVEARNKGKPKEAKLQNKKRLNMVVLEKRSSDVVMDRWKPSVSVETMKLQKPRKSTVPLTSLDKKCVEEKVEATKRRLQEDYMEGNKGKRQRRGTQVIEVHDMLRLGLAPKHQDSRFGKHNSSCGGLVRG